MIKLSIMLTKLSILMITLSIMLSFCVFVNFYSNKIIVIQDSTLLIKHSFTSPNLLRARCIA